MCTVLLFWGLVMENRAFFSLSLACVGSGEHQAITLHYCSLENELTPLSLLGEDTKQSQSLAKHHYHCCSSEMLKAWAGIWTEVSSLSASKTIRGMSGISFFYSVPFFGSPPITLIWVRWWSKKAVHTDCSIFFQLKACNCSLAGRHAHLREGERSLGLVLLSICNQHIWKYFKVSSACICLHITKYC